MSTTRLFKLLVVEDNVHFVAFLRDKLTLPDYDLDIAENAEMALHKFQRENYDLVLLDLGLPRRQGTPAEVVGFELLKHFKMLDPTIEVIVITGTSTELDSVIRAIKEGAYHFLIKDDYQAFAEKLYTTIQNALQKRALERNQRALLKQAKYFADSQKRVHRYQHPDLNYHFGLLLGESEAMQELYSIIQKVALRGVDETVLIYGEPGTGKELAALSIHAQSGRGERPWIVANIAALAPNLVESELFGIEARTATGVSEKVGYFEQADSSSIFLDEVSEMPAEIQVKLLRVLQQKEIQRVGSAKPLAIDVRVIAATNRNLKELVQQNKFREDLYYRLAVLELELPPLRARRSDIPLLIQHVLHALRHEESNHQIEMTEEAVAFLQEYDWPGNIRELENVIKKAAILRNHDKLNMEDFGKLLSQNVTPKPLPDKTVLGKLPVWQELSPGGEIASLKSIQDKRLRHQILLRILIEQEGHMEAVLEKLDVARNTGYKFLEGVWPLFLAGLCQTQGNVKELAAAWSVESQHLERTIRRANRLADYFAEELQTRFGNDLKRMAAFLNVTVEQLGIVGEYLKAL